MRVGWSSFSPGGATRDNRHIKLCSHASACSHVSRSHEYDCYRRIRCRTRLLGIPFLELGRGERNLGSSAGRWFEPLPGGSERRSVLGGHSRAVSLHTAWELSVRPAMATNCGVPAVHFALCGEHPTLLLETLAACAMDRSSQRRGSSPSRRVPGAIRSAE